MLISPTKIEFKNGEPCAAAAMQISSPVHVVLALMFLQSHCPGRLHKISKDGNGITVYAEDNALSTAQMGDWIVANDEHATAYTDCQFNRDFNIIDEVE